ncbi:hypothetical protein SELMODRAFT_235257 [Selaginella moellendorffii]|uniref:RRM domain-containing protein n=1 Tax=Selaginella moellendorffii TaxID=88036 RepID=D8SVF8_SELML|nr:hypothetical protein SELMODRAFT_235257 [Selaginella moellendorffii]
MAVRLLRSWCVISLRFLHRLSRVCSRTMELWIFDSVKLGGMLKNCAFLDFPDDASAARAQSQLHRVRFLGKTLTAEKSRAPGEDDATKKSSKAFRKSPDKSFLPRSHSSADPVTGSFVREPIAPSLGVDYPFPPHLEYAYPPPDDNILSNISSALIAVPSFYTQVLHLMNKMNLPAPFRPAVPKPPLPCAAGAQERPLDLASDESELESSEEEDNEEGRKKKRRRKEVILGPATAKDASHEAAGVKPVTDPSKAVTSIKKKQPVIQIKIPPKVEEKTKVEEKHEEVSQDKRFATREELEKGKLSLGEVASHPVFKNYSRGTPSPVLYIKNLEKEVVLEDLHYVFGAFFPSYEEAQAGLNVKLMQEGRMKGQAFVRFPSAEIAGDALAGVHSFVLKGKPMVIQYGRNK